jgi:hypothetical protein
LLAKSLASTRRAIGAFNAMDDDGRQTTVLLHLQHAAEMLLKAGLAERRVEIVDRRSGRSIGFATCLNLASEHLHLTAEEVGVLRTVDALRDDEQHFLLTVSEELLFLHVRAAVQVIDQVLQRELGEPLADHLPERGLPITTKPIDDFDVLVDRQWSQVTDLLRAGRRRTPEARARIRGLLALEGHAAEDVRVSETDVNRVERAAKAGQPLENVFPRLRSVRSTTSTAGPSVTVHFTKRDGAPVTFVPADDPGDAAAVRQVDLRRKFHMSANELASRLGLTSPRATALRRALSIDDDQNCRYEFTFGGSSHVRYSDNAFRRMREAMDAGIDMDRVWAKHRPTRAATPPRAAPASD